MLLPDEALHLLNPGDVTAGETVSSLPLYSTPAFLKLCQGIFSQQTLICDGRRARLEDEVTAVVQSKQIFLPFLDTMQAAGVQGCPSDDHAARFEQEGQDGRPPERSATSDRVFRFRILVIMKYRVRAQRKGGYNWII